MLKFEVGEILEITVNECSSPNCVVVDYDRESGLLEVMQNGQKRVFNTNEPSFEAKGEKPLEKLKLHLEFQSKNDK